MSLTATDSPKARSTTWLTPIPFVRSLGEFDLDPCGYPGHETAKRLICLPDDGLKAEWSGRVWLNPPYGKEAKDWVEKLRQHGDGIAIVFARMETKWIQPYLIGGFFQILGRMAFMPDAPVPNGHNAGAPSILIQFGRKNIGAILASDIEGRWFQ